MLHSGDELACLAIHVEFQFLEKVFFSQSISSTSGEPNHTNPFRYAQEASVYIFIQVQRYLFVW